MTPEEHQLLSDLAAKIQQTPATQRDPEAEEFIRRNIGSRPDALYLMTQTVLIQNMALQQAQQQIRDLQQRTAQPQPQAGGSSFLGQTPQYSQPPQYSGQRPAAPPAYPAQPMPAASGFAQPSGGGGGGFLRSAAQTAAGVAAGALAFEGIESLFGHSGGGSGFGQAGFFGGGGGGRPVEEVVNNYYDSPSGEDRDRGERLADTSDNQSSDNSNDDSAFQTQNADYDDSSSSDDSSSDYDDSNLT